MESLFNLGLSENTLRSMLEQCPDIKELSNDEVISKINILKALKCRDNEIINIISSNAIYLNRSNNDIEILLDKLIEYGFSNFNILFDSNPYILNLSACEIENYIEERLKNNELLEDIVDDLESNPYLFNEF